MTEENTGYPTKKIEGNDTPAGPGSGYDRATLGYDNDGWWISLWVLATCVCTFLGFVLGVAAGVGAI